VIIAASTMLGNLSDVVSVKLQGLLMESFLFSREQCSRCAAVVRGPAPLLSPIPLLRGCEGRAASTVLRPCERGSRTWLRSMRENQRQGLSGGSAALL